MEGKQSSKRSKSKPDPLQQSFLTEDQQQTKGGQAKRGTRQWDQVMLAARKQAEDYARALPVEHGYPPFLLVVDVGHVIEIYADFSGQGKNYAHFPDRRGYRIAMEDLRDPKTQARLAAIWNEPQSLDPARISAEVTNDIAARLAKIARHLEKDHAPNSVADFLMRCLFTMFAEDVGLLPENCFCDLLSDLKDKPESFVPALENFWRTMDKGGYESRLMVALKRFNGSLFKAPKALPLDSEAIVELWIAARRDWRDVEPAIFGTLLESALDKRERSKLGAHYTPRAYVERLVIPTIVEPLRDDWKDIVARVQDLKADRKNDAALRTVRVFHDRLCRTRVLDPACGTGNFLYIAFELMKRLEGEVLNALEELGEEQGRLAMRGETVDPSQFYGLELNPRAVAIADLVLWIGYLKWQIKTVGPEAITEPVLQAYGTIREQDAILAYDREELVRDAQGKPISRWDGVTMKPHPITGEPTPDPDARMEIKRFINPRPAKWPEAEFIVGNPPFIGGKDMRQELGDGYAEACWTIRPHIPGGADFVMHFWDQAASQLRRKPEKSQKNPLRRFGFITTNSVTQTFSRRVIERYLAPKKGELPISLLFAIADHPWLKAPDKAAVRIAMTVAARGERLGILAKMIAEAGLNSDTPRVELAKRVGRVTAALRLGADTTAVQPLLSNEGISSPGVKLHGAGFIVDQTTAKKLGLGTVPELDRYIVEYRNGKDITARPRNVRVIDLFGLDVEEVRKFFPKIYQHLYDKVRPDRLSKIGGSRDMLDYAEKWWLFGKPRLDMRSFTKDIGKFICTVETSKHRFFQFLDSKIRPDNMLVNVGIEEPEHLSVLSSRISVVWSLGVGATLEDRPRFTKSRVFDPYPFPDRTREDTAFSSNDELSELGERLDAFRKERLEEYSFLTMTGMYNVLERVRELENDCDVPPLTPKERDTYDTGLIAVLKDIHDEIDRAAFEAYGWSDLAPALVGKPGATTPSPHKSPEQEEAEQELLGRLVALNKERAEEEARGLVRWLRPDYQIPKLGHKVAKPSDETQLAADVDAIVLPSKPKWPSDGFEQIRVVRDLLSKAEAPVGPDAIAAAFGGRVSDARKRRVTRVLNHLVETGLARSGIDAGEPRYFAPN